MAFISTKKLKFEILEHKYRRQFNFRIGTVIGIYEVYPNRYVVVDIRNEKPGNGHAADVLEWFSYRCKRKNRMLEFYMVINKTYSNHLIEKHGFQVLRGHSLIKHFDKPF